MTYWQRSRSQFNGRSGSHSRIFKPASTYPFSFILTLCPYPVHLPMYASAPELTGLWDCHYLLDLCAFERVLSLSTLGQTSLIFLGSAPFTSPQWILLELLGVVWFLFGCGLIPFYYSFHPIDCVLVFASDYEPLKGKVCVFASPYFWCLVLYLPSWVVLIKLH